jgi:aspartoacylase
MPIFLIKPRNSSIAILDYLEVYNQGKAPPTNSALTLYQYVGMIDYPRNENGEIQAMIHPQLQGKDYEPLNPGEPIFLTFDNQVIDLRRKINGLSHLH